MLPIQTKVPELEIQFRAVALMGDYWKYICSEIGAKILRLPSVAQDDTVLLEGLLMKDDDN